MLLTIESKFNIGDNVHVPKGERKVLGVKLDSKGILYLLESADGTREWVREYWIVVGEQEHKHEEFEEAILNQLVEDNINPFGALFRRFRKKSKKETDMLIEQYIKHVERYFWDRKQIQKAVDEEREQRTARKGHTGGGGHAFISNPTETAALKNIEPVRMISFGYGPYQSIIMNPELWLEVVAETYKIHENQLAGKVMYQKYEERKPMKIIAELTGVNRDTCYEFRKEFLRDAVYLASKKGLIK